MELYFSYVSGPVRPSDRENGMNCGAVTALDAVIFLIMCQDGLVICIPGCL